jgi:hypothetical protein
MPDRSDHYLMQIAAATLQSGMAGGRSVGLNELKLTFQPPASRPKSSDEASLDSPDALGAAIERQWIDAVTKAKPGNRPEPNGKPVALKGNPLVRPKSRG